MSSIQVYSTCQTQYNIYGEIIILCPCFIHVFDYHKYSRLLISFILYILFFAWLQRRQLFFSCLYLHNLNFSHLFTFWIFFCSGVPRKHTHELDWSTRLSILKHIAEELVFLHEVNQISIFVWNLTTQSIFLDNDLNPTIVDFGPSVDDDYIQYIDYTSVIKGKRYLLY